MTTHDGIAFPVFVTVDDLCFRVDESCGGKLSVAWARGCGQFNEVTDCAEWSVPFGLELPWGRRDYLTSDHVEAIDAAITAASKATR